MSRSPRSFPLFPLILMIILTGFVGVSVIQIWSSSQLAKQAIDRDIRNYKEQTHNTLQLFLDNHFNLLNLLLNHYAENGALLDALIDQDTDRAVDSLFDLYNSDTGTNFDLLFVINNKDQIWMDSSSKLFQTSLPINEVPFKDRPYSGWFLEVVGSKENPQLVAFKRVPLVDDSNGRVMAHLVGGMALTGNLGVITRAQHYLSVTSLALRFKSTIFENDQFAEDLNVRQVIEELNRINDDVLFRDPYVISRYTLKIEDDPSQLEILVRSKYSAVSQVGYGYLSQGYRLIPLFLVIAAIISLLLMRVGIRPLLKLVLTAKSAVSERREVPFHPTLISEYNILGSSLSELVGSLKEKEHSLQELNEELEQRVIKRTEELQQTHDQLLEVHRQLMESEKLASLGQLVAGMAHEINTPLGVCLTAITTLQSEIEDLQRHYKEGTITRSYLEEVIDGLDDGIGISIRNLMNTTDLVGVFKQVAVDQASEMPRDFELKEYLEEVIKALSPMIKRHPHQLMIDGPDEIRLYSYPGYLNQIMTNLIQNSLVHGLKDKEDGIIQISFSRDNDHVLIHYRDNGTGMDQTTRDRCFDPFYTTKRGEGSTGLGMSVIYNLTVQGLNGSIKLESQTDDGVKFEIRIPLLVPDSEKTEDELELDNDQDEQ
ncbi:MAG: ATP-binding protein [Motiliproteus sp.]|nr:ATP-binding protein [Motiliproteus sp.]MCW9053281.1 ATP-binding protein [Motiliproteus sp.]